VGDWRDDTTTTTKIRVKFSPTEKELTLTFCSKASVESKIFYERQRRT
jgi:hypothetical protein